MDFMGLSTAEHESHNIYPAMRQAGVIILAFIIFSWPPCWLAALGEGCSRTFGEEAAHFWVCERKQRHQGSPLYHSSPKGRGNSNLLVRIKAFLILPLVVGTLMWFSHGSGCPFPSNPPHSSVLGSGKSCPSKLTLLQRAQTVLILHNLEINNLLQVPLCCVLIIVLAFFSFSSSHLRLSVCRGAWWFCSVSGKKVFIICQSVDASEQAGEAKLAFKEKDELKKKYISMRVRKWYEGWKEQCAT